MILTHQSISYGKALKNLPILPWLLYPPKQHHQGTHNLGLLFNARDYVGEKREPTTVLKEQIDQKTGKNLNFSPVNPGKPVKLHTTIM